MLTAFVLIISIIFHRKTYGNRCKCKHFFEKVRHRIFILLIFMLLTAIIRENFFLKDATWPALILLQALRFLVIATSIMSFIYSAEELMKKNQIRQYIIFLWGFQVASMLAYLAIGIYEEVIIFKYDETLDCHSFEFIATEVLISILLLVSLIVNIKV